MPKKLGLALEFLLIWQYQKASIIYFNHLSKRSVQKEKPAKKKYRISGFQFKFLLLFHGSQ